MPGMEFQRYSQDDLDELLCPNHDYWSIDQVHREQGYIALVDITDKLNEIIRRIPFDI